MIIDSTNQMADIVVIAKIVMADNQSETNKI